jgi:hypothetical protein
MASMPSLNAFSDPSNEMQERIGTAISFYYLLHFHPPPLLFVLVLQPPPPFIIPVLIFLVSFLVLSSQLLGFLHSIRLILFLFSYVPIFSSLPYIFFASYFLKILFNFAFLTLSASSLFSYINLLPFYPSSLLGSGVAQSV